ncbi:MAG TPA: hypothetical protein VM120_18975 [Bryobacteraceae bacterium]|nr:hypothetical protein [Bryobacteraceae bacterium]
MSPATSVSSSGKQGSFSLAGIAALTVGATLTFGNVYLVHKTNRLETRVEQLQSNVKAEILVSQQETASRTNEQARALSSLRQQVELAGITSTKAAGQASLTAKRNAEELSRKLAAAEFAAIEQQKQLSEQLGEVKQANLRAGEKISGITTEVSTVKSVVAQTKTDLEKTIGDLHSVRGDLGVQSGLVATNGKELAALRALGERAYFEFQLTKTKAPQRIGDVAVQLKRFDAKRNRYTIELVADDKRVEKKDRSVNEPVQFYMAKARIPYEIVVNEVKNDRIVGYLSAPKVHDVR